MWRIINTLTVNDAVLRLSVTPQRHVKLRVELPRVYQQIGNLKSRLFSTFLSITDI